MVQRRGSTGRDLPADKKALLEQRLRAAAQTQRPQQGIPRLGVRQEIPLSLSQQRLWFLHQIAPEAAYYNISRLLELTGPLRIDALEHALQAIVRRHEALRTTFEGGIGGPCQRIAERLLLSLPVVDLCGLPADLRGRQARRLQEAEARRPFDLARGPLLRLRLLRLEQERHLLQITLHHIVADGWSMAVLFREMEALYRARLEQRSPQLEELPIQFADFAVWQRQRLQGAELDRLLDYWRNSLQGADEAMQLHFGDRHPAAEPEYRGGRRQIELPEELARSLRQLGRSEGVTLFMTLLAAFQFLLGRYSGNEDVVVGFPVAGRDRREVEGLIGFFVNTLVLRTRLGGAASFRALLQRVRPVVLEAFAHQEMPFEKLVEAVSPERSTSRNPLFQVMFVHQSMPASPPDLPGLKTRVEPVDTGAAMFDLTLAIEEEGERLVAGLQYNAELFDTTTAARILGHFRTLLHSITVAPDEPLRRLPVLSGAERHQLLVEWNDTAGSYDREASIPALFAAQAAARGDAVALVCGEQSLSYRELDERSGRVAGALRSRGLVPGHRVAVHLERSPALFIVLLGILKAGGAYVPLEVGMPEERRRWILEEAAVNWLIHGDGMADVDPDSPYIPDMSIPINEILSSPAPASTSTTPRGGEALAYIMYTSGSTGRPKGVAIPHRAVVRLVRQPNFMELGAQEVFLQFAPVAFDASTLEIWGPLLNGGRLVIMEPGLASLEDLGAALQRHGVTILWLTAGLFHQMVERSPDALAGLHQLLAGGDVLSVPHVRQVLEELDCRLINGYGPTENTTFTCCHTVSRDADLGTSVPIGRPITGTRSYVLDHRMRPVPVGVVGELYAGGDGLAWGYIGRGGLTAERFVPDPFGTPGGRLYRTGDQVRWTSGGQMEFLGRYDHQIKLRGYRIELGEIESVLAEHPTVETCAVVLHGEDANRRLVALVTGSLAAESAASELGSHLAEHLPGYMVPAAWIVLDQLPLNANGKVDRRRLTALVDEQEGFVRQDQRIAPRTDTERVIAEIWQEVLKLQEVGMTENFFQLGGQSLLATQIIARIQERLEVSLPLRRIFDTPTVEGLAQAADEGKQVQSRPSSMQLTPSHRTRQRVARGSDGSVELPDHLKELL